MIPEKHYAVAVDGPSGAGKSTLAKAIAAKLGILYVDTGAIYRTIGYAVKRRGIEPRDEAAVRAILPELEIGMRYEADGEQHMLLNGQDVTREIRLPEISMYASAAASNWNSAARRSPTTRCCVSSMSGTTTTPTAPPRRSGRRRTQ